MPNSTAPQCALVIFGASGDLAKRKLIPALYELVREKMVPDGFALIGFARTEMTDEEYRNDCRQAVEKFARTKPIDNDALNRLLSGISYCHGDYGDNDAHAKMAKR